MAKANPKAWFTSPIAKITYGKVDKWAKYSERFRPFFPTWKEAHGWMLAKAEDRLKKAQAELKSATKHHEKVVALKEPAGAQVSPPALNTDKEGEQPTNNKGESA
jgi:hypothetical protein